MLNIEYVEQLRHYLYEKIPHKILQLTSDIETIYKAEYLQQKASSVEIFAKIIPMFENEQDICKYRQLNETNFESDILLLPHGLTMPNQHFEEIYTKLLNEIHQLYMWSQQVLLNLPLLQPPFGEVKSFDSHVLSSLTSVIENAFQTSTSYLKYMQSVYQDRGRVLVELATKPQFTDVRHYLQEAQCELFDAIELKAMEIRNTYATVNQFAVKNRKRIDDILNEALKNAKYGLKD